MIWLFAVSTVGVLALGRWSLGRVRIEYQRDERLSRTTAAVVWSLYTLHLGLTVWAALEGWWPLPLPALVTTVLGAASMLVGTYVYAAGLVAFRSVERMSGMDTSELVRRGIHRWSRNPQNVGWALFLGGIAIVSRSGAAMVLVVLFLLMFRLYVPIEEAFLGRVFGKEYRSYRAETARYVGIPRQRAENE